MSVGPTAHQYISLETMVVTLGCRVSTLFLEAAGVKGGEKRRGEKEGLIGRHCYLGQLMFGPKFSKITKRRLGSGKSFRAISPKGNHAFLLSF